MGAGPHELSYIDAGSVPMLLLRDAATSDLKGLKRLAAVLNSVNLPDNEEVLSSLVERSVRSFSGKIENPFEREYLFVLQDPKTRALVGTSMIIAQHGTWEAPHIYFQVTQAEHYSASIDAHFKHTVLSIGYNYEGPTEIGGLVVDPPHRSGPEKPGKQLSYGRFLFMAMHKKLFRERVLAELLPPLLPDGRSLLWESCGKKFTGLEYPEADKLSRKNKEFIRGLFPEGTIYASLLPKDAQDVIGKVGAQTRGVEKLLRRIGFRYAERVDPFDGGPHFTAMTDEITLVSNTRRLKIQSLLEDEASHAKKKAIVATELAHEPFFRAMLAPFDEHADDTMSIGQGAAHALGLDVGSEAWVLPLE
jgi:arginine N-succinyltransferase